ncbi:hypothetical protein PROFUN_09865 [Planoprotostelium fungivorum]|uniref:UDENN FLCN/SMCR8-type domain-containing protein n=1 Tax=Planoprotostelium fungivorum TaxID=1890364 RepID=A0A2P6NGD8_9EUKA|nr:hypothetical protein PROFUN_09865 [Planoprotostelium fungivorum]
MGVDEQNYVDSDAENASSLRQLDQPSNTASSEFSELEGPIPLFTVPEGGAGAFNVNEFVLRIMAVDNQNKGSDIVENTSTKDMQVVLSEHKEGATAYVHHFNLLDLYARGYVRPICISYITRDPKKIMCHFEDFLQSFSEVTEIFKSGNRQIFRKDISLQLDKIDKLKNIQEVEDITGRTPETMSEYITDLKILHGGMEEEEDSIELSEENSTEESALKDIIVSYFNTPGATLRTLEQLCGQSMYSKGKKAIRDAWRMLKRPAIVLALEREDQYFFESGSCNLSMGSSFLMNFSALYDNLSPDISKSVSHDDMKSWASYVTIGRRGGQDALDAYRRQEEMDLRRPSIDTSENTVSPDPSPRLGRRPESPSWGRNNPLSLSTPGPLRDWGDISIDSESDSMVSAFTPVKDHLGGDSSPETTHGSFKSRRYDKSIENFSANIWNVANTTSGRGLLDLRNRYNSLFLRTVMFSLLRGRTVIILGNNYNETAVGKLVTCLTSFIPGTSSVTEEEEKKKIAKVTSKWHTKSIKLSDLSTLKLIGMKRDITLPKVVERYVTIWDYEAETILGPPYTGNLLDDLLSTKKVWPDENTFLAHIQCILFDLAIKVYIMYQSQLYASTEKDKRSSNEGPGSPDRAHPYTGRTKPETPQQPPGSTRKMPQISKVFRSASESNLLRSPQKETSHNWSKNIPRNDMQIIEHLVEIVKMRQVSWYHQCTGQPEAPGVIQLDYSPVRRFKNSRK